MDGQIYCGPEVPYTLSQQGKPMKATEMRRWTREEYERMIAAGMFAPGERLELVDGEILQMPPQGSVHATVIQLMSDALRSAFGPAFSVRQQLPIGLAADSEPEPDLAVVAGTPRDYWDAHPRTAALLVEVSDATPEYDRRRKGSLYARAGVCDFWIVNLVERCIEVYREPHQASYGSCRRVFPGDRLEPLAAPGSNIQVADLFPQE
jgi:Uma2 family endonuclease